MTCESRNSSELVGTSNVWCPLLWAQTSFQTISNSFYSVPHQYSCTANNCKDSGCFFQQPLGGLRIKSKTLYIYKQYEPEQQLQKAPQAHTKENNINANTERATSFLFKGGFNFLPPTLLQHFRKSYSKCSSYQQDILPYGFVGKLVWILCCTLQYIENFSAVIFGRINRIWYSCFDFSLCSEICSSWLLRV